MLRCEHINFLADFTKSMPHSVARLGRIAILLLLSLFMVQTAFAQTVIYQDDFEGAVTGWSDNQTDFDPDVTRFLGRFDENPTSTSRTFTLPPNTNELIIEFDLYRFDSWDNNTQFGFDRFEIDIDGTEIFSLPFPNPQAARSGTTGNVDWEHSPLTGRVELAFNTGQFWFDQLHRYRIVVNNPGPTVALTLRADLTQGGDDESAGYDNFLVTAITDPPEADLVTVKTLAASSSATPFVGDIVTYDITVTNNGPDIAENVTLTDALPAGLTATGNNGQVTNGTYAGSDWTIPALPVGQSATLTLEGSVDAGQEGNVITNTLNAPAASDAVDLSMAGDDLTESITVQDPQPSLSMEKAADSAGPFTIGDVVTYTYTITNDGDTIIRNIAITDTHNGSGPPPTPSNETLLADNGVTGDSTDTTAADGTWDVLAPGDVISFTGSYTITQTDAETL